MARHAGSDLANDSAVVLSSIVSMAQSSLNRSVVVEGVEGESGAGVAEFPGLRIRPGLLFFAPAGPAGRRFPSSPKIL